MCGIVGFLDKADPGRVQKDNTASPLGQILLQMLTALGCRGPDSAGVALYQSAIDGLVLRVKLGDNGDLSTIADEILERVRSVAAVREHTVTGPYLRLIVDDRVDTQQLVAAIEDSARVTRHLSPETIEVISMGHSLEIVKQVGTPQNLETAYGISKVTGTHGLGHTRLSTESRVDLSHSQPFWAHGMLDVASVHNGHITNCHNLRRKYEQRGVRFYTENDSEIIGVYIHDRMSHGNSLEEALRASLTDLDGSFCYLVATPNALAFVKDPFGLKPLVVAETEEWVAIATEEIALRQALGDGFATREPEPREIQIWQCRT